MVYLDTLFWIFVILFGLIGMMRGWAKEMLVTFSVILALFIIAVLQQNVEFIKPLVKQADSLILFWLRTILLVALTFFGYQTPNIPKLASSGRFARDKLQDSMLGLFLGAINGYLVCGTFWYFLDKAQYPFKDAIIKDLNAASVELIKVLPPNWLLEGPTIFFAVAIAFAFVLVVFL